MDNRFPGYMRIRVDYPLSKALLLEMEVNIRGHKTMGIMLRYENVLHFCFTCGCMGHAAISCDEGNQADHGIKFGEELRALPPRCAREISVKLITTHVARPVFEAPLSPMWKHIPMMRQKSSL
jgi:hypothetical protein